MAKLRIAVTPSGGSAVHETVAGSAAAKQYNADITATVERFIDGQGNGTSPVAFSELCAALVGSHSASMQGSDVEYEWVWVPGVGWLLECIRKQYLIAGTGADSLDIELTETVQV